MKLTIVAMLVVLATAGSVVAGGFILKEENDFFSFHKSDKYYTQGMEFQYVEDPVLTNGVITRRLYGLRNTFYTPKDITKPGSQPDDRPWAGLTAASITTWEFSKKEFKTSGWLVGVVGDWSQSDALQIEYHGLINSRTPMGWTNQIPNEPILNYTEGHYREEYMLGMHNSWGFDVVRNYGYSAGNAFVYGDAGYTLRAGWGIPEDCKAGVLEPTLTRSGKYSCYMFAGANGKLVLHNILLGGSLLQDGPHQDLKPFVLDLSAGMSLAVRRIFGGRTDFGLSYILVQRSKEFEEQGEPQRFGSITLAFMKGF